MPGTADQTPVPPVAPRIPSVRELHGRTETDNYAWMRAGDQRGLLDYLAAERAYYDAHSQHLADLTGRLLAESAGRTPGQAEDSVGWPLSGFIYRTRTPEGRENLQFLRSRPGESGEQLLLDENIIGAATGYVDVGVRQPSPDSHLLAWSADTSGAEIYQLRIRDLRTGRDLPDLIERSYPGVAWSAAGDYLFYLAPDELNRPFQVWRHQVGGAASDDAMVFEEPDGRFELTLSASRSGALAIITSASRDTTEVRLIPLSDPLAGPVLVQPRRRGVEYRIDHARPVNADPDPASAAAAACAAPASAAPRPDSLGPGRTGWLYIVTDDGCPEFTLMRAPARAPGRESWARVDCAAVPPRRSDTRLLSCDVIGDRLLLTLRRDGAPLLAITDLHGGSVIEVPATLPAGSIRIEHAADYDAAAADGTPIPVTLAYPRRTRLDGTAPCLVYGYGAYESCSDPEFSVGLPSLLDRGVVYAIAHIRGGGERGRAWWQQGRLRAKPTTFADFIDVADWLAGRDGPALVDGDRIVSRGLSAGGLLQGAVYSIRPDRWRAVVAEVPFVDCVTTMLDPSIPLTINEWDEWGDPRDPDDYACIKSYSPYDNPPVGRRPALLVTGAVHDPRGAVHEPAKWVARLRETDAESLTLFRVELGAGAHTGPSGRFAQLRYDAEVHAFVLDAMAISS